MDVDIFSYFVRVEDAFPDFTMDSSHLDTAFICILIYMVLFGPLAAFHSDWILAAIAGTWAGAPSSDIAVIYWIYFASKRLPMLSW